jgi:endonuclease/exonuclease/phosphatase family metal-dependent hydrolase
MSELRVSTYNIHKGYSSRHGLTVHALREELRRLAGDLVFLQEVQGLSLRRARHPTWPATPQYEFLADSLWSDFAYGRNAVYDDGHHGNAILSKYPILRWDNEDISQSRFEQRGLLHCEIAVSNWSQPLHCINVHFGLLSRWRHGQLKCLGERIEQLVPAAAPLIVAGDFNDWGHRTGAFATELGLTEAFEHRTGRPARSFPARLPLLRLDRIYTRGFHVQAVQVHHGPLSARLSDHAALSATLVRST